MVQLREEVRGRDGRSGRNEWGERMKAKLLNTTMVFSKTLCHLFATS